MLKNARFFHILYIAIIAILVVVIVVLAIKINTKKEEPMNFGEYYKIKTDSFNLQNENLAEGQIVFIGDSITDSYVLDDYYYDLDLATYNRGISGDSTAGVLNRLKVSLFDIKPSKIVLMIGTNDVNGGVSDKIILSNYQQILTQIKTNLPNAQVFCVSIIPQNPVLEKYSGIKFERTSKVILNLNPQIKTLVESNGAVYVDLYSQLADSNNNLIMQYSDDGLHLNAAGFEVWTNLIKPYL